MRKTIDLVILLLVVVGGFFAVRNAGAIGDWWHAQRYTPPTEIKQLAEDAGMSDTGKKLFYRFSPELVSRDELDPLCNVEKLGCVEGQSLSILAHETDAEDRRSGVTAAHEMLHVAYSRLDDEELEDIHKLLKEEVGASGTSTIAKKLQDYSEDDYYVEAYAYIGSELGSVSSELEMHYQNYFSDRNKTVEAYVFSAKR
jgi:hypothetical protein